MSIKKILLSTGSVFILAGILGVPQTAQAFSQSGAEYVNQEEQELFFENDKTEMIEEVKPYVYVEQGYIALKNNIPDEIHDKYDLNVFEKHFERLNGLVDSGQISINNDLSIIENEAPISTAGLADHGYSASNFWWGSRTFFTNRGTREAVEELRTYASIGSAAAVIGIKFPPLAFGGGLTSAYLNQLANRMEYHNQGSGVIVDMHLTFTFSVKPRVIY